MVDLTGWKLTFDDEFDYRSISQDGTATTWSDIRPQWRQDAESDTGFGNSSFVDAGSGYDPFTVANGALSITAVPDRTPYGAPGAYESGLISTQKSFSQTYGYFEIRAETSNASGSWDAFWLLPEQPTANQELDVMEHLGNNDPGTYSTIHTTDNTPAQQLQVYSQDASREIGYHTYGMDWEPDRISFYVDGQLMGSQATPSDMHSPMYLLADLATETNASTPSLTMNIDYIRAFSKDPSSQAVTQDTVSAPDGKDPGLYGAAALPTTTMSQTPDPTHSTTTQVSVPSSIPAPQAVNPVQYVNAVDPAATASPTFDPTALATTPDTVSAAIAIDPGQVGTAVVPSATSPNSDLTTSTTPTGDGGENVQARMQADGRRVVDVLGSDQTLQSTAYDTFLNHGQTANRFVFDPGFGRDILRSFVLGGGDHDTIDLPSSDFIGLHDVFRDSHNVGHGVCIVDPVSGDRLRIADVTKGQLFENRNAIAFHD